MHYLFILFLKGIAALIGTLGVIALIVSTLHGRLPTRMRTHRKSILITTVTALCVLFLVGQAMNHEPSLDFFLETSGPGNGVQLPLLHAAEFLWNIDDFRTVEDIAAEPNAIAQRMDGNQVMYVLEAEEVINEVAPGVIVNSWTYNGQIPGPMLRAKVGDTVTITIRNKATSLHTHNIDLHAVNGPGGGATVTNVEPGQEKTFSFKALNPGLYVYHCAAMGVPGIHMAHGQYGLILIEPTEGMPAVDKEFYVMQGEIYTTGQQGDKGLRPFSTERYLLGDPTYVVFNGRVGGLNGKMHAQVGDRVRIYVGNGGVNLVSSFHVIGEVFDVVYPEGGWPTQEHIQSTVVPAGGSTIVEFTLDEPGKYLLVDHALARVDKGAWGTLEVTGEWNASTYAPQPQTPTAQAESKYTMEH